MAVTPQAFAGELGALLPRGRLWRGLLRGPLFSSLLLALGDGLARFRAFAEKLPQESDPRFTTQLLPEWEQSTGLPDDCIPGGGSTEQRRNAVVARLRATGGASPAYFVELAATYGYTATVDNLGPNHWRITVAEAYSITNATCRSTCIDELRTWGNDQLECLINRLKHSHTQVDFAYGAP
jgi:uncharacterized protein YmfQ (DUF2313 family)